MSLTLSKETARRLQHGRAHQGPPASALFGCSVRLLDAADELERTAPDPSDEQTLRDSLGCLTATFDALATVTLQLGLAAREVASRPGDGPAPPVLPPRRGADGKAGGEARTGADAITYMMFAASQNLRLAAETAKQAQRSLWAARAAAA